MGKRRNRRKKNKKPLENQENVVNLQPSTTSEFPLIKRNVNQLWDWNTLEDIKL